MKAIMIFDFDDDWIKRNNIKLNNLFGHVVIYEKDSLNGQCDYTNRRYWCFNSLKPMPQELPTPYMMRQIQIAEGIQTEKPPYTEDYQKGYNDCLGEILEEADG